MISDNLLFLTAPKPTCQPTDFRCEIGSTIVEWCCLSFPMFFHVSPCFCLPVQAQGQVVGCLATNGHHHPTRRLQLRDVHDTLVAQFFKVQAVRLVEVRGHRFLNMAQPWHRPGTHLNFPTERLVIRKASIALNPSQKDACRLAKRANI